MGVKEHFCRYSKHSCPDCGSKIKIFEFIDDEQGVFYTEIHEVCEECGYQKDITDKRNKNTKIEIRLDILPDKKDKSKFNNRR